VPGSYEIPRQQDMATRLGRDHGFRFAWNLSMCTVSASFCPRVVLMSLTIRTLTRKSNIFIPPFLRGLPLAAVGGECGVMLMVAPRTGKAGQQGNSVGAYICGDLACSLYTRGKKFTASSSRLQEQLTLEEKIGRNVANLSAFLAKVTA
jgi:FBP C-terminal treble-clef zinc-finger